jgi:uncharacterized protein (DUF1697 family)
MVGSANDPAAAGRGRDPSRDLRLRIFTHHRPWMLCCPAIEIERYFRCSHNVRGLLVSSPLGMALVVFLRGVNVGGHRTFRPSILARELTSYGVVNVGAAGTFVVRKPVSREKFRAALLQKLPFEAHVVVCDGRDLLCLEKENPFGTEPADDGTVRFVSVLSKAVRVPPAIPITLPPVGEWFVRLIAVENQFVFGMYRRHMKTIGYLGQIDKLFGVPVTTRNWNTIVAVMRILKDHQKKG